MQLLRLTILILFATYIASCGSQRKLPVYYLETSDSTVLNDTVKISEIKIQKNDLLSIQIYSSALDPAVDAPYNLPGAGSGASVSAAAGGINTALTGTSSPSPSGFLVDENGNIEYPRLGTLHTDGLTKSQLAEIIKGKLTAPDTLLRNPAVIIRFLNYKVTVLGEVNRPGPITIPTGHITILEALGLAGDIPVTGKKNTVKVLRETDGKRQIGIIDLTSKNIFDSPYYNLLQNDVVMVEATKAKIRQSDQLTLQRITTVLGVITSLTLVYNILK